MFRQYDKFNQHAFADFLMQAVYKFKKICLIMDKASQHRATKIRELVERTDGLEIIFLPTATPDLSAIETYWRDLKRAVLGRVIHQPAYAPRGDHQVHEVQKTKSGR